MLQGLFGNENVARILLFLFVNETCYATQIHSLLQVPLTPIQKALFRLEKECIVKCHYEGKLRIYQLNLSYPLYNELEMLLKKAYTLLSSQEKKRYCFIHKPRLLFSEEVDRERTRKEALSTFWAHLSRVQRLVVSAKSHHHGQKHFKNGIADVQTLSVEPSVLIFQEKGRWIHDADCETAFSNCFRWTLDLNAGLITLEHLRYGVDHPVFLFHLTLKQPGLLESLDAHLCGEDTYLGNIIWDKTKIDFHWRIVGAQKNEYLSYRYTKK